jgi:hypothetical protein
MTILRPFAIGGILLAVLLGAIGILLSLLEGKSQEIWGGMLLNIASEALGWALGLVAAAVIGVKLAKKKLEDVMVPLVELVAELRESKSISPHAARKSVICSVKLLSDEPLGQARKIKPREEVITCGVCQLRADTELDKAGHLSCVHCGLRGNIWELSNAGQ